jgi:hypothetical protein
VCQVRIDESIKAFISPASITPLPVHVAECTWIFVSVPGEIHDSSMDSYFNR